MIKSLFEVLEDRSVTDFTVDGKCSNCGACCSNVRPLICRRFQCNRTLTQVIAGGEFFHRTQKLVDMREEFFRGGR